MKSFKVGEIPKILDVRIKNTFIKADFRGDFSLGAFSWRAAITQARVPMVVGMFKKKWGSDWDPL